MQINYWHYKFVFSHFDNPLFIAIALTGIASSAPAKSPDPDDFQSFYQGTWIQLSENTIANGVEGEK